TEGVAMRPVTTEAQTRADRTRRRPSSARKSALRRVALEALEPRALMAVLPTPTVTGQVDATGQRGIEYQPTVAVDPTNPLHAVIIYNGYDPINNQNQTNYTNGRPRPTAARPGGRSRSASTSAATTSTRPRRTRPGRSTRSTCRGSTSTARGTSSSR